METINIRNLELLSSFDTSKYLLLGDNVGDANKITIGNLIYLFSHQPTLAITLDTIDCPIITTPKIKLGTIPASTPYAELLLTSDTITCFWTYDSRLGTATRLAISSSKIDFRTTKNFSPDPVSLPTIATNLIMDRDGGGWNTQMGNRSFSVTKNGVDYVGADQYAQPRLSGHSVAYCKMDGGPFTPGYNNVSLTLDTAKSQGAASTLVSGGQIHLSASKMVFVSVHIVYTIPSTPAWWESLGIRFLNSPTTNEVQWPVTHYGTAFSFSYLGLIPLYGGASTMQFVVNIGQNVTLNQYLSWIVIMEGRTHSL